MFAVHSFHKDLNLRDIKEHIREVSVPNDFGLNRAEREKVTKYQDLKNDLRDTWNLNTIEIIPVIVGATGVMKTNLKRYLQQIPGNLCTSVSPGSGAHTQYIRTKSQE